MRRGGEIGRCRRKPGKMFSSLYVTASARLASRGALKDLKQVPTMADMHFLSYVLLNLSLPSSWDRSLAERWLADKKKREESQFSVLYGSMRNSVGGIAADKTPLWKYVRILLPVFGLLNAGVVWRLRLRWMHTLRSLNNVRHGQAHKKSSSMTDTEPDGGMSGVGVLTTSRQKHNYWYRKHTQPPSDLATPRQDEHRQLPYPKTLSTPYGKLSSYPQLSLPPRQGKTVGCEVVKQPAILHWILTFINHTCLWVNSQLHRFNKRCASKPGQSMCLIYTGVREIIMEILRGRWTLITAQNKSRGDMKIDRRFSPSRLQVGVQNWNNTKHLNISSNIASWGKFWLWRLENYVPQLWVIMSHYRCATIAINNSLW